MGTTMHAQRMALVAPLGLAVLMIAAVAPSVQAAGLKVSAISAGLGFTCARSSDGAAWCWGDNSVGELGDGTTTGRLHPVRVIDGTGAGLAEVRDISAGSGQSCARTADGAAWCWGINSYGQLGDGTYSNSSHAVRVIDTSGAPLGGVIAISAGANFSCALATGGVAWCWGDDYIGQLGDGTSTASPRAVRVTLVGGGLLAGATAISAGGSQACVRTSSGTALCWGYNNHGQLGDGTTTDRHGAVQVTKKGGSPLTRVTAISAGTGYYTCARTSDGAAWCWGDDRDGELGDGGRTDRHSAVRVNKAKGAPLTGVSTISAAIAHACVRTTSGAAWCWGPNNGAGQLGDGSTKGRLYPVQVSRTKQAKLAGVSAIDVGGYQSCARTSDGAAWCWGYNGTGQLGDGTTTDRTRAVRVIAD